MPYPTLRVDLAFGFDPYTDSVAWTEVTQWVREFSTDRGRSDDWDAFNGSASVVLDNRDRRFDPFNTSSPYVNQLLPRCQIRIMATYGGTDYPIFRGFVNGFSPDWVEAGKDSTVTLSCFDAIALLASETLPADWSNNYIISTSPRHYYPLNEPIIPFQANQTLVDYGSYPQNLLTTTAVTSSDQLASGLVNSSIQGTGGIAALSGYGVVLGASSFTVSMWAILDTDATNSYGEIGNVSWTLGFSSATSKFTILIDDYANSGLYRSYETTTTYDGGAARMISFSFDVTTKAFALYLDGVAVSTNVITGGSFYIPIGEQTNIGGQIQQLIIWTSVVSQATIQNIYKYSTAAFNESSAARFQRIIGETPFPSSLTSPPSSPVSTVLDLTDEAPKVASELQLLADSEYAPLFVTRDGIVTLYDQNQIRTQTRSIVSQGSYGAGGIPIGKEISLSYDGDSMRNRANITMSKGGVLIDDNSTSQNTYGVAEQSISTQVASLANAESIGNIVTGWGGEVYPKMEPFEVVLSPDNDWSGTLNRELNDRITVAIAPPTGNTITVPMLLSRIQHNATPAEWHTTFEGSARWAAVWIWDTSVWDGTDLLA